MRRHKQLLAEIEGKQRNIVFPDTVRNARGVDSFLWKGSANPTPVQRIAAWLFGLTFVGGGIRILDLTRGGGFFFRIFTVALILLGVHTFRNGFRR